MIPYPAALYVHIPFCLSKCDYCDFFSITDYTRQTDTIQNIVRQIQEDRLLYGISHFSSVYIGGGTPGSVSPELISFLLNSIASINGGNLPSEVTMECNPGNVSVTSLEIWQNCGINRISLGIQTFRDESLKKAGRQSSSRQIYKALDLIKSHPGFNLSLDLIQGLPGMGREEQLADIEKAASFKPDHISWYSLTLEKGTVLAECWKERQNLDIAPEVEEQIWKEGCLALEKKGYHRYEISNFAKPGRESIHNSSYWHMSPYLGVGPGAVSMVLNREGKIQRHRIRHDVEEFAQGIIHRDDRENPDPRDFMKDYFLMGLRLKEGISIRDFHQIFGAPPEVFAPASLGESLKKGMLERTEKHLRLTEKGMDLLNSLLVDLFGNLDETPSPEQLCWPLP